MTQDLWNRRTQWPLAVAALLFLAAYSVEVIAHLTSYQTRIADMLIWVVWAVFAIDYGVNLFLAPQKGKWFIYNLHELLMLALPMLRPLRLLRLVVLLRVVHRATGQALRGKILFYVLSSSVLLTYSGALAVLAAEENATGSNIKNIGVALWWAVTTITTVGYGDFYPVTATGRAVAAGLMIGGITVLSVVTASMASWLVENVATGTAAEIEASDHPRVELAKVSAQLDAVLHRLAEMEANGVRVATGAAMGADAALNASADPVYSAAAGSAR